MFSADAGWGYALAALRSSLAQLFRRRAAPRTPNRFVVVHARGSATACTVPIAVAWLVGASLFHALVSPSEPSLLGVGACAALILGALAFALATRYVVRCSLAVGADGIELRDISGARFFRWDAVLSFAEIDITQIHIAEGISWKGYARIEVIAHGKRQRWDIRVRRGDLPKLIAKMGAMRDLWSQRIALGEDVAGEFKGSLSSPVVYRSQEVPSDRLWEVARNARMAERTRLAAVERIIRRDHWSAFAELNSLEEETADSKFLAELRDLKSDGFPEK